MIVKLVIMIEKCDFFDGEYIGNIFGFKLMLYGVILILFFIVVVVYWYWKLDVLFGMEENVFIFMDEIWLDFIVLFSYEE